MVKKGYKGKVLSTTNKGEPMAANNKTYDRVCISVPIEISTLLRTKYPYMEFSSLIVQLLEYAHAAGFMMHLDEMNPEMWKQFAETKRGAKPRTAPSKKQIEQAVNAVVGDDDDDVEEFGT